MTPGVKEKQTNGDNMGANEGASASPAIKSAEQLPEVPKRPINCFSCGIDCSQVRFHHSRNKSGADNKFDICPGCFQNHRYSEDMRAIEFVKLEDKEYSSVPDRDAPWTDTELLLLLEGLEEFDDNWNSIADHVGTRTREECVVKFLQLEIEDKYFESEPNGQQSFGTLDQGRVPFTQGDNPVMSVIAFLAAMSEPGIAAAAAGRSVDEMRKSIRNRLENGVGGEPTSQGQSQSKDPLKTEDFMDVDPATSPQANVQSQAAHVDDHEGQTSSLPTIAFAASAARAAALASNEEREMTRLVSSVVNTTLQKLELKIVQFSEMETVLQAERRELERGRQQLFLDRLAFRRRVAETQEAFRTASLTGGEEAARIVMELGGGGEKPGFKAVGTAKDGIEPLALGEGGAKSHEI